MGDETVFIRQAIGWAQVGFLISICFAIPAFVMAFLPERAFRTRYQPRWLGVVLLVISLYGAFISGTAWLRLRAELSYRLSQAGVIQSTSQPK